MCIRMYASGEPGKKSTPVPTLTRVEHNIEHNTEVTFQRWDVVLNGICGETVPRRGLWRCAGRSVKEHRSYGIAVTNWGKTFAAFYRDAVPAHDETTAIQI